jgi:hypothetical protein
VPGVRPPTASELLATAVVEPSAREIASPDQDHVMVFVVETYVNAPDHVGGTEPFISTPGFVGSILFDVSAAAATRAKFAPSVTWSSSDQPWFGPSDELARRFSASYRCGFVRRSASICGMVSMGMVSPASGLWDFVAVL